MTKILFTILTTFAFASCSYEIQELISADNTVAKTTVRSMPFCFDGDSRTSLTNTGNHIHFTWDEDEAIGVFPVSPTTNSQAYQSLNSGKKSEDGMSSSFDGAGWQLKPGNTYAAYYPYNGDIPSKTNYKSVPVDMTGQTQHGDASLEHIGNGYDYMYSYATIYKNTPVDFTFNHLCSIIMIQLKMPVAADWKNISLTNAEHKDVFITKGTFDATNGKVEAMEKSKTIRLELSDITTVSEDEVVTFYIAALPTTTGYMTVTATASDGVIYAAGLESRTLKPGYAYKWSVTPIFWANGEEDGYGYVDLGLDSGVKWANMNVGATTVEGYGKHYAWGETAGYGEEDVTNMSNYKYNNCQSYVKTYYTNDTYKYYDGGSHTKYSHWIPEPNGFFDGKKRLSLEDDAAYVNMGSSWRTPTAEEVVEVLNTCLVWTDNYNGTGIAGMIFFKPKSEKDVIVPSHTKIHNFEDITTYTLKDAHIFLPLTGIYWADSIEDDYSIYLSSELDNSNNHYINIIIANKVAGYTYRFNRDNAVSVRAVHR